MKKQNALYKLVVLATLFAMSVVITYAQVQPKESARKTLTANPDNVDTTPANRQLVYAFNGKESILVWLNNNPTALMAGGPGNGGGCKFQYTLLPVVMSTMSDLPEESLPDTVELCIRQMVVPNTPLEGPRAFKGKEFDGTVYDPFGPQPKAGMASSRGAANATLALFSMETGKLEATTTTDREGRYKFSGIPEGRKAIFVRDKRGNLIYRDNVQVCGRGVNGDGKGCTGTRIPRN
ncbi:MAG TPA: carboxypeptidase-like regulatory domain-containing protein [Pyrinomonadaceae bacterium]|nr:carboxypeptidase-like regulatory domain-containing protein [Pyrinomonadaceae bacterium]